MKLISKLDLTLTALLLMTACQQDRNNFSVPMMSQQETQPLSELPTTYEDPESIPEQTDLPVKSEAAPVKPIEVAPQLPTAQVESNDQTQSVSVEKKSDDKPVKKTILTEASKFIQTAYNVMIKEGKKIGTPCNFYLQRVLIRFGFKHADFVANDFDIYAKNNFKSYKHEDFKIDATRSDKEALRQYLWSYEERTPFILQWTRSGNYGHVAVLERIKDNLVIYQASIGIHSARRDLTTIQTLLSSKHRAQLTVYSEFQ